jgi:two-component system NtrC family sensor kinase
VDSKAPKEIAKDTVARLLLSRERELYELQQLRRRAENWLSALHAVWPERFDVQLEALARRATDLLVGELSFEIAAAFEYLPESGALMFGCCDPHPLAIGMNIDPAAAAYFETHQVGRYGASECPPLEALAARLGLAKFFWRWCSSYRDSRFLFLAGYSPRTAQFHVIPETDRDHFAMFTSHAAALLSNSLLVADVRHERAELELANRGLDVSLSELRETQAKLVASTQMVALASRQAGMAEIATGILHNVGNVLNSVNVCSEVALEGADALPVAGIRKIIDLLRSQSDLGHFFGSDPRGPKTIDYLDRLGQSLGEGQAQIASELGQLKQHLAHVRAIVSRQQTYAKVGATESCDLSRVMEDALVLARNSHHQGSVEVIKAFSEIPLVAVDRHRVLQILVNLITNALQALKDSEGPAKHLIAHVRPGNGELIELAIEDNGIGIAPEDASRVFQHGFTTRRDGHGFGLHTSVLTAKELGGELRFESAGRGQGATFILELPTRPETRQTSASRNPRGLIQASAPDIVQSQ